MHRFLPPLCLLLALVLLITGFAMLAVEPPQASVELHAARVSGDDQYRDLLESQLTKRRFARKVLLACVFAGSGLMVVLAFLTMVPSGSRN
jgi:hypothetical protein